MTSNSATASFALFDCSGPINLNLDIESRLALRLPAALRLLHAVLAEHPLARGKHCSDPLLGLHFRHRASSTEEASRPTLLAAAAMRARTSAPP